MMVRIALGYFALSSGYLAVWILAAPQGFYDAFPTGPAEWVSALPPYNEHILRDFGAAALDLTVLAALAAVWLERRLVQATAIAFLVYALPHMAYHLTTTERYTRLVYAGSRRRFAGRLPEPVAVYAHHPLLMNVRRLRAGLPALEQGARASEAAGRGEGRRPRGLRVVPGLWLVA